MTQQNDWRTAIVLQGGGALGAYEYGVVKALYECRQDFTPAVVTGISIGAINTAVLVGAKDDPIKSLDYVWREKFEMLQALPPLTKSIAEQFIPPSVQQSLAAFGNPGMYQINPAY